MGGIFQKQCWGLGPRSRLSLLGLESTQWICCLAAVLRKGRAGPTASVLNARSPFLLGTLFSITFKFNKTGSWSEPCPAPASGVQDFLG